MPVKRLETSSDRHVSSREGHVKLSAFQTTPLLAAVVLSTFDSLIGSGQAASYGSVDIVARP
jgi:hypothetical protein